MERSCASNCPTAAYQLVGTKKIQQALAEPGVLERSALSELFCPLTELSRLVVHYAHLEKNLSGKTISSRIKNWGLGMTRNVVHQAKTYSIPWQYPISQYIHTYMVSEPFPQYASTGYCYWRQRCSLLDNCYHIIMEEVVVWYYWACLPNIESSTLQISHIL